MKYRETLHPNAQSVQTKYRKLRRQEKREREERARKKASAGTLLTPPTNDG